MLALILVEAGLHPSFLIGGDVNEIGTNAVWDSGEWIVVEADESDGTFLHLVAGHRHRDQRRGRPPRPLRVVRRRADRLRRVPGLGRPPGGRAATTPRPGPSDRPSAPTWWACGEDATHPIDRGGHRTQLGRLRPARTRPGPGGPPVGGGARAPQRQERRGGHGGRPGRRRRSRRRAARALARFGGVARRFEFRGELDGVTYVDDYAHLPTEVGRRPGRGPQRRLGPGRRRVPAPPLHADGRGGRRRSAGAFDDADVVVLTDVYGAGEAPVPGGVGPAGGRRRAPGPARRRARTTCRAGPTSWTRWPTLLRPGRPVPDPRRRRPHLAARRAHGRLSGRRRRRRPRRPS